MARSVSQKYLANRRSRSLENYSTSLTSTPHQLEPNQIAIMDIITSNTTSIPSASTLSGFTFENWGPVTTTFTPPSSCITASNKIEVGPRPSATHSGPNKPIYAYNLQCETIGGWECYPSATVEASTTPDTNPTQFFRANYYSPGLYCPHEWVTVGLASWDGDGDRTSLVTSGIFVPTTTAEIVPRGEAFLGILGTSETAVACCPR